MVISKPKRILIAAGFSHFMVILLSRFGGTKILRMIRRDRFSVPVLPGKLPRDNP
jgi:hypothetical protein